jgi:glycine dehydrogenase subunit 1
MKDEKKRAHPYIPNSEPEVKQKMLEAIGAKDIEELYQDIPERLRYRGRLNLPEPLTAEMDLKRHVEELLSRNRSCDELVSFLGAGCYNHYVPAICDEINHRSEFLTAYAGEPYEDQGRFQALFEYESLMAELLDMDVVNVPTYDWFQAAGTSLRMAGRITRRKRVLVAAGSSPERMMAVRNYCRPVLEVETVAADVETGLLDLEDLKSKLGDEVAAVYFENPGFLGVIETEGRAIADLVHANSSLLVVGVDPISLGILAPPSHYGADIICGDIQTLGNHMNFGGGMGGFISTRDEERFVMEYPSRLFGVARTAVPGEYGFGDVAYDRTSFGVREKGKEFVGTAAALHGITAAVYLALLGPVGMKELGQHLLQKSQYAIKKLSAVEGLRVPRLAAHHFREFVVDFNATARTVAEINRYLLTQNILGGWDLSSAFPRYGQSALFCVTELTSRSEIDRLAQILDTYLNQGGQ